MIDHIEKLSVTADLILEIEAELRQQGKWEASPPPAAELKSMAPFCCDTLSFTQWLQWVFLKRIKKIVETQSTLPFTSCIHPYAEDALAGAGFNTTRLLDLIHRFDDLYS